MVNRFVKIFSRRLTAVLCAVLICYVTFAITTFALSGSALEQDSTAIKQESITNTENLPGNESAANADETKLELTTEEYLTAMANMNYCFGYNFDNTETMAQCAALSLIDYAVDIEGVGLCVNVNLVAAFIKSFYGIDVDVELLAYEEAPKGYVLLPQYESATMVHSPISVTEKGDKVVLITLVELYFGGDDIETHLAKTEFVKTDASEFTVRVKLKTLSPDVGMSIFSCQAINVYAGERENSEFLGLVYPPDYNTLTFEKKFTNWCANS